MSIENLLFELKDKKIEGVVRAGGRLLSVRSIPDSVAARGVRVLGVDDFVFRFDSEFVIASQPGLRLCEILSHACVLAAPQYRQEIRCVAAARKDAIF
jgi:hypothetical protein